MDTMRAPMRPKVRGGRTKSDAIYGSFVYFQIHDLFSQFCSSPSIYVGYYQIMPVHSRFVLGLHTTRNSHNSDY